MSISIDNKYIRLISSRLRNFKQKNTDLYNFSCPFCNDSAKNPRKARGYVYRKINDLFYKCHNCPASTNMGGLVERVDPTLYKEYLMERYTSGETGRGKSKAPKFNIPIPRFDKLKKEKSLDHAEWCSKLPEDHPCIKYLISRQIPLDFYDKLLYTTQFKQFVDNIFPDHDTTLYDEERMIIPFYDDYNKLIAVSGRSMKAVCDLRYVTVRADKNVKLVFGMERVDKKKLIRVVEGPIDSLFLKNCIASADANLDMVGDLLIKDGVKKENIILIPDREPRNKEIISNINRYIKKDYKVICMNQMLIC